MNRDFNLLPKYLQFKQLATAAAVLPPLEFGHRVWWKGQIHFVIAREEDQITVIDEWATPSLTGLGCEIENWQDEPSLVPLFPIEDLLQAIFSFSGNLPVMTPGIRMAEDVWQVKHPQTVSVVAARLEEALLDIAIQLLTPKEDTSAQ